MYAPRNFLEEYSPYHKGLPMLFVHTPKCGGSFVAASFRRHFKKCISLTEPSLAGHLSWTNYRDRLNALGQPIIDYKTFSVIRNPFAWQVSWFTYIRGYKGGKRSGYHIEHDLFQKMTFSDYVTWLDDPDAPRSPLFDMGKQVSSWVLDEQGNIAVDHILRQETLENDLKQLATTYGLRLHIPRKPVNVSNKKQNYQDFYTARDVDRITARHQRDIQLFGYLFDPKKGTAAC